MQKKIIIIGATLLLAACSTTRMDSLSQIEGLTLTQDTRGYEVIDKYRVNRDVTTNKLKNTLPLCIAQEIDNKPVSLTGSSTSFWGGYDGYYYSPGKTVALGGGDTIKLIEGNSVVASGITEYAYDSLSSLTYYIRYTLTATKEDHNISYLFSHIMQARQDTGATFNNGFDAVETTTRAHPDYVINALNKQVEKINRCLLVSE